MNQQHTKFWVCENPAQHFGDISLSHNMYCVMCNQQGRAYWTDLCGVAWQVNNTRSDCRMKLFLEQNRWAQHSPLGY